MRHAGRWGRINIAQADMALPGAEDIFIHGPRKRLRGGPASHLRLRLPRRVWKVGSPHGHPFDGAGAIARPLEDPLVDRLPRGAVRVVEGIAGTPSGHNPVRWNR